MDIHGCVFTSLEVSPEPRQDFDLPHLPVGLYYLTMVYHHEIEVVKLFISPD